MVRKYSIYVVLLLVPVIINYVILSWRAPGVNGDANAWLGFFSSYIGLIGAVSIAVYQINKQKQREDQNDREANRSYVLLQDFSAPVKLINVRTHENSRLIETEGYKELLEYVPKDQYEYTSTAYLKISQYGNPEVISDCKIYTIVGQEDGPDINIDVNLGIIEKGIEVFIPLVPPGVSRGSRYLRLSKVTIEYSTIRNERLNLVHDLIEQKDTLKLIESNGDEQVLYEYGLLGVKWIYPNKMDR